MRLRNRTPGKVKQKMVLYLQHIFNMRACFIWSHCRVGFLKAPASLEWKFHWFWSAIFLIIVFSGNISESHCQNSDWASSPNKDLTQCWHSGNHFQHTKLVLSWSRYLRGYTVWWHRAGCKEIWVLLLASPYSLGGIGRIMYLSFVPQFSCL